MHAAHQPPDPELPQRSGLFAGLRSGTIRNRLLVAFMLLVLLPAALISLSSVYLGLRNGQQQVVYQLQSVATLKEEQIEAWLASLRIHIATVIYAYQVPHLIEPLLTQAADTPAYVQSADELRLQFAQMIAATELFEEVMLLDTQGRTLLSTNLSREGQVHVMQEYFWRGLQGAHTQQSLAASTAQGLASPIMVAQPVYGSDGTVLAVVVGRASSHKLNAIMIQAAGLGESGETYLVGPNALLLTDPRFPPPDEQILRLHTPILEQVFQTQASQAGLYQSYQGEPVVGVYHWVPALQLVLVAEQGQPEAFQATYATLQVNIVVAGITVLIALSSALFIAQGIAAPLADLAETATQIAAGNLKLNARITRTDEVGALALAFNRMTDRLRELIGSLRQHVAELEQAEGEVRRVNARLARDIAEQETLNRLSSSLQRCQSLDEAYTLSAPLLRELFAGCSGAFYRYTAAVAEAQLVYRWGHTDSIQLQSAHTACPLWQPQTRGELAIDAARVSQCGHADASCRQQVLCVQIHAGNEPLGMLQLHHERRSAAADAHDLEPLAIRVADLLALALSNLQLREHLREQALRDPLTGLFNRRFVNQILGPKLAEAQRHQASLGFVLLDVDHFKRINDTFGHDAGDATLRTLGRALNAYTRAEDVACRFGGEEFLLIMTPITAEQALLRANALRELLSELVIEHNGCPLPHLTASIGIAIYPDHGLSHDDLLNAADQALYRAKATGRNRVCLADRAQALA
jgi:diguanylate cyclase (GGDEF)-like protein